MAEVRTAAWQWCLSTKLEKDMGIAVGWLWS
jgi:hypothetical protein